MTFVALAECLIEPGEEFLQIYYLLDVVNKASVPVNPTTAFAFDMPSGSTGCGPLEGASAQAKISSAKEMRQTEYGVKAGDGGAHVC